MQKRQTNVHLKIHLRKINTFIKKTQQYKKNQY